MAESVDDFLARLASDDPAPGGGAAAALAVAIAAALVSMVGRVTLRREPGAPPLVSETVETADRLRTAATDLGTQDSAAYAEVVAARRRPADERAPAVAAALKHATDVPITIAATARDVLAAATRIAPAARPSALSDLGVAAALAWAALEAGTATARSNLVVAEDETYTRGAFAQLARLIDEGATLRRCVTDIVAERS